MAAAAAACSGDCDVRSAWTTMTTTTKAACVAAAHSGRATAAAVRTGPAASSACTQAPSGSCAVRTACVPSPPGVAVRTALAFASSTCDRRTRASTTAADMVSGRRR